MPADSIWFSALCTAVWDFPVTASATPASMTGYAGSWPTSSRTAESARGFPGYWWDERVGLATPAQHRVDESSAGSPVAIRERVDVLELCMRDGRLRDRSQVAARDEAAEVVQELGNKLRRWRYVVRSYGQRYLIWS